MKIELKQIKFSEAMSEETNAFTADLYINGKKVGYCRNSGHGGCTDYNSYSPELRPVIAEAETYCKTLPKMEFSGTKFDQSLESVIDELLEDWIIAKERKKMEKRMETGILWGKPKSGAYTYLNYKIPLKAMVQTTPKTLQERIDKIKADHCTGGVVILNTNLQELGLRV